MKTLEQIRIEAKLKLWDTPGFFQFIEDLTALSQYYEDNIPNDINFIKRKYEKELKKLEPKSKFKQGKLPL